MTKPDLRGKGRMRTARLRFAIVSLILCLLFIISACKKQNTDVFNIVSLRYETIATPTNSQSVVYSSTDNTNNYYVLSLGNINSMPVASQAAYAYSGIPITLSFSKESIKEETIQQSSTEALTQCISVGSSLSASLEVSSSIEASVPFIKAKKSIKAGITGTISQTTSYTRSITNTYSSSTTNTTGLKDSITYTIGNNNEAHGKYRLALFATVDVYFCVKLNKQNTSILETSAVFCARPLTYTYVIDYDPDINGTFKKSSENELLNIPTDFYSSLPQPTTIVSAIDMGEEVPAPTTHYISTTSLSCKLDNGYNHSQPDPNGNDIHFSHNFSFGDFVVNEANHSNGNITLVDGYNFSLGFRLGYDADSLPLQDNMTSRFICSDGKMSNFYNLPWSVGERTVGKGMLVVLIHYNDGTPDERICITDVFKDKKAGNIISIADGITKPCTISISILYEVEMWAPGLLWSDNYWMNWRINQSFIVN